MNISVGLATAILFGSFLVLAALGLPIGFLLGSIAVLATLFLWGPSALVMIANVASEEMRSFILIAAPLFFLMSYVLEKSGVADDLFEAIYRWVAFLRGGLAIGVIIVCTLVAAMVGVIGAGVITMGIIALPAMLQRGYSKTIALGPIAAGGALGTLIPPSVIMILYSLVTNQSVGKMFAGGIFPGLLLATLYITYIGISCWLRPQWGPTPPKEAINWKERFASLRAVVLPILLIVMVLGSIFMGVTTPSEAAAVGAVGALICAAIYRRLRWQLVKESLEAAMKLWGMGMWIIIGAFAFSRLYVGMGALNLLQDVIATLSVGPWGILIIMQVLLVLLGLFVDEWGIVVIAAPLFVPIITSLGFDPLWFGILFMMNMQIAVLTPPYGFALFYLRGVAPEGITMRDIYRSIIPFVMLQILGLAIVMIFPQIAVWLPNQLFR